MANNNAKEKFIGETGFYISTPEGISMLPFLRGKKDNVVIVKADNLKKFDVILYHGENNDVLHRIIKIKKDGTIITRGDNCFFNETVKKDNIVGKLFAVYRDEEYFECDKSLKYRIYSRVRVYTYCLRYLYVKFIKRGYRAIRRRLPF